MNFYKIIAASIMIFSHFLCKSMDEPTKSPSSKKYLVDDRSILEITARNILALKNNTPEETEKLGKLFDSMNIHPYLNQTLLDTYQPLQNRIKVDFTVQKNRTAEENNSKHSSSTSAVKQQQKSKYIQHQEQKEIEEKQRIERQKQEQLRQKEIRKKIIEAKKQEAVEKKASKTSIKSEHTIQNKPFDKKKQWEALKHLMRRFEIPNNRDIQSLIKKLKLIVESIDKQSNNHEENVYFDYEIHVLTGKINKNWSFIYCPCKKAVTAINKEFNCIQKNLNVNDLPKNFSCNSSLCKNYKKIEIRSLNNESGSDSDMDTANDPETFISKIDLDEF